MATDALVFRVQAASLRAKATASNLPQVRERCARAAEKLDEMAAVIERTEQTRDSRPK